MFAQKSCARLVAPVILVVGCALFLGAFTDVPEPELDIRGNNPSTDKPATRLADTVPANLSQAWMVSSTPLGSLYPSLVVDAKKNVHVVWSDEQWGSSDQQSFIYYRMFNSTLRAWSPVINVSENNDLCRYPDIAIDTNGDVHVCWLGKYNQGERDVYYRKKTSSTGAWGGIVNVSDNAIDSENMPKIAVNSSGAIQIVWLDDDGGRYHYKGRLAEDGNWATAPGAGTIFSDGTYDVETKRFDLAADQSFFHLVWTLNSNPQIVYYMNSSDGSLADSGTDRVALFTTRLGGFAHAPTLFIANSSGGWGKAYVAFRTDFDGNADILTMNATNYRNWGTPVNITRDISTSVDWPEIAVSKNGTLFALYAQTAQPYRLLLTNSTNYGAYMEVQESGHVSLSDQINHPSLAIDVNGSLHFAWENGTYGIYPSMVNVLYREFDFYLPQLKIATPGNNTVLGNNTLFTGTCDVNTQYVNISYRPSDIAPWTYIGGVENDTTNFQNGWSVPWHIEGVSHSNITIRVNATDFNGVSEEKFLWNVTLDTVTPNLITIQSITDSRGNTYAGGARNFTDTITITYNAVDDVVGVDNVTIWNGTTRITSTIINTSLNQIVFTESLATGNWSTFYLRATDKAGNYNDSATVAIRIDYEDPQPRFKNPVTNDTKFRQTFRIAIEARPGFTDVDWKSVTFYSSPDGNVWTLLGTNSSGVGGEWSYLFDSLPIFEDPQYYFRANVTDDALRFNWTDARIYIDNNKPNLLIDVEETADFSNDDDGKEVGLMVTLKVLCDDDTTVVNFYNRSASYEAWNKFATNNSGIAFGAGTKIFTYVWNTYDIGVSTVYLKFECIDDVGNTNDSLSLYPADDFHLILQSAVPKVVTKVNATLLANGSIFLEWVPAENLDGRVKGYRIYRMYYLVDIIYWNVMNPQKVPEYLTFLGQEGVIIADWGTLGANARNFTDTVLDPNTYYYVIITFNIFNNPSDIPTDKVPGVVVPKVSPNRPPDERFDDAIWWVIYFLIAIWIILPTNAIVTGRRAMKRDLIDFTMDVNVIKGFDQVKSFEKDVSDLDLKMRKELGLEATSPAETDFLAQEVVQKKGLAADSTASGMHNCPKCGWVLSATATKCIRCGHVLDQTKEGGL